ncbi:hypothetical protein HK103_003823 [Boothiomyces macroporosus]|uniref:Uncharacterized protein n=1 Tax=Boothiomyces macroporosus TaxID=261099 RepID=A0AAD5UP80_9FUNG|nr:hypothetical protein HK103_003823 [Boothiomyces macroporosus]
MGSGNSTQREPVHSQSHRAAHSPSNVTYSSTKPRTTHAVKVDSQRTYPVRVDATRAHSVKAQQNSQPYQKHYSGNSVQKVTSSPLKAQNPSTGVSLAVEDSELKFLMETAAQPVKRRRSTTPQLAMIQEDKRNKDEAFNESETSPVKFDMERFQKANISNVSGSISGSNGGLYKPTDISTNQPPSPAKHTLLDDADESLMDEILAGF